MSKTRKRVLSVLTILFAIALVFTACFALAGCGDDDGSTGSTETTWPTDWTVYTFNATKGGVATYDDTDDDGNTVAKNYGFWIMSDGTTMFGKESEYNLLVSAGQTSGSTGYWGYLNGTLTFVKASATGATPNADGGYDVTYSYSACTTTTSGNSVTVTTPDDNNYSATIDDIGCLAGKTGYDLTTLEIS